ncbi:hypothetical protein MS3_00001953 [Schistosoma haematobium]|uniref:Elongation factor Ts, mitochondrial n=1 Tax=Schistosoma haematobium TaxID=6185 RepID=A0A922S6Z6_SCHHA|nr:hypothetical protein MS3_00001953 [Schistosoma haematobium]KAH9596180.1 hypothetical protein MS3_00001953 [Schistosoma haematobium]
MNVLIFPTLACKTSKFCVHIRLFSQAADKALLYKLRKLTGFTFSACKEALIKHENDLDRAKEWLASEAVSRGWEKAGKLAGRAMNEGLLGVLGSRSHAIIVEVNCETDFVARNHSFQSLVATAAETVLTNYNVSPITLVSKHWSVSCPYVFFSTLSFGDKNMQIGRLKSIFSATSVKMVKTQ